MLKHIDFKLRNLAETKFCQAGRLGRSETETIRDGLKVRFIGQLSGTWARMEDGTAKYSSLPKTFSALWAHAKAVAPHFSSPAAS